MSYLLPLLNKILEKSKWPFLPLQSLAKPDPENRKDGNSFAITLKNIFHFFNKRFSHRQYNEKNSGGSF